MQQRLIHSHPRGRFSNRLARFVSLCLALACGATSSAAPLQGAENLPPSSSYEETMRQFARDKDMAKARNRLLEAIKKDPRFAPPYYTLGLFAEADENWGEAIQRFEEFLRLEPGSARAELAKRELKRAREALEADKTPEGKRKRKYEEAFSWARALSQSGLDKEAIAKAAEAAKIDASRWEAYAFTADILYRQGRLPEAAGFLQKALEVAPKEVQSVLRALSEQYRKAATARQEN